MRRWSIDQGQQSFCANDQGARGEGLHDRGDFRMAQTHTQTPNNRLYLDDLVVGQRFTSRTHVVDATEIKAFARQFDPQPFHLDEETANRAFFGELVASGWHTAAITMRLLVETGLPLAGGIIGAGGEVSWPQPTRPGDTLAVTSEIEEITPSRSRPDRGTLKVRSETRNQRDEIVQVLLARLTVPRRVARP
jgi:acyl dehydratase